MEWHYSHYTSGLTRHSLIHPGDQDRSPHRRSRHRVPRRTLKSQWDAETNIWVYLSHLSFWKKQVNSFPFAELWTQWREVMKTKPSKHHAHGPASRIAADQCLSKQTNLCKILPQCSPGTRIFVAVDSAVRSSCEMVTCKDSEVMFPRWQWRSLADQLAILSWSTQFLWHLWDAWQLWDPWQLWYLATHQNAQAACMLWIILFLQSKHLLRWHKCQPWAYKSAENG